MSKLFSLKEWLTVAETAKHLAGLFGEEVTEADVLRLSLDGRLTLSVFFVNHATARLRRVIPLSEAKTFPSLDGERQVVMGTRLNDDEILDHADGPVVILSGVWDLPMIGGEALGVEQAYQNMTEGPEVTLMSIDGAYVVTKDGDMYELQNIFDDGGASRTVTARGKKTDPDRHYYPAGDLPEDSVLVVRTKALRDFEQSINGTPPSAGKSIVAISDNTLVATIAALLASWPGGKSKFPSAKELENSARLANVSVSDDSIRKALNLAKELAPSLKSA